MKDEVLILHIQYINTIFLGRTQFITKTETKWAPFIYPAEYAICEPPVSLQYRDIHVQILQ